MDIDLTQFTHKSCWVTGNIEDYKFEAKHFDEPSEYGIKNGRISKLCISNDNDIIARYDRGWDIRPSNAQEKEIYNTLVDFLEDLPKRVEEGLSL